LALCLLTCPVNKEVEMKKILMATLLSSAIAVPAMAASTNNADLADTSIIFNIQDQQSMELEVLSFKEMKETEDEMWPIYAGRFGWGAVGGGIGYATSNWGSSRWSWGGFGRSVAYGGVGGLVGWNSASSAVLGSSLSNGLGRWGW
jgi:hypothetical protein